MVAACSATLLDARKPEGLRTGCFPRKHSSVRCLPGLSLSPGPALSHGKDQQRAAPATGTQGEEAPRPERSSLWAWDPGLTSPALLCRRGVSGSCVSNSDLWGFPWELGSLRAGFGCIQSGRPASGKLRGRTLLSGKETGQGSPPPP